MTQLLIIFLSLLAISSASSHPDGSYTDDGAQYGGIPGINAEKSDVGMDDLLLDKDGHKGDSRNHPVATIFIIITAVGLLANSIVFFVIFCGDEINKTVTAIYVVQLALADSIFLVALPFFAMQQIHLRWMFGEAYPLHFYQAACTICQTIMYVNYYAGIFFLTAMSIDRYIAVAYSTKAIQLRTKRRTLIVCFFVWIAAAIMSLPAMLYASPGQVLESPMCTIEYPGFQKLNDSLFFVEYSYEVNETDGNYYGNSDSEMLNQYELMESLLPGEPYESENNDSTGNWTCRAENQPPSYFVEQIVKFIIGFVIPFAIITVSYVLIIKQLRRSERRLANATNKRTHTMRKRVTRMVSALVICFVICWLPYHIFILAKFKGLNVKHSTCYGLEKFVVVLGYANSAFNPILYTFLGHNFKERLADSLQKTRKRLSRSSRAFVSGPNALSRQSSHKDRFRSKPMNGRETGAKLFTNCDPDSATVVTENHIVRDSKKVPLLEMNLKKQIETPWRSDSEQNEKA